MKYRPLGRTGLQVSTLCLGTAFFGSFTSLEDSIRIIHRALDLGVNFFDAANTYGDRRFSVAIAPTDRPMVEEIVGQALKGHRQEVVITTKVCEPVGPGINQRGLSRKFIMEQVEISLRRLQTDFIDLYYAHHVDPRTPVEETMRAFDDLVRQGKVRYVGLSNWPSWMMTEALWAADKRNLAQPQAIQILYNVLYRLPELEQLPAAQRFGLGAMIYSPLAGGVLTGKYRRGAAEPPKESRAVHWHGPSARPTSVPNLDSRYVEASARLVELAEARGHTAAQEALAWVVGHPAVTAAIMGASSVEQLESNLPAFDLEFSSGEREELAKALGFGAPGLLDG
jgi:aryl-alcohol dehydrogenase-like predicted oxidoreductase